MIKVEEFINALDNQRLQRLYSDKNCYLQEVASGNLYAEAIIPMNRSVEEFMETDQEVENLEDLTKGV